MDVDCPSNEEQEEIRSNFQESHHQKQYHDHGPVSRAGEISGPEKNGSSYRIRCTFYPEKRSRGKKRRISSVGYESVEEAQADQELFRFAVDLDGAVDWQSPAQLRLAGGVVSKNQMDYIHLFRENFDKHKSKTTSRAEESLSCSAVKELKKINSNLEKNKHLEVSRFAFSEHFNRLVYSDADIARFKRNFWRKRFSPDVHKPPAFLQTRKEMLTNRATQNRVILQYLREKIMTSTTHLLIVRNNEHHSSRRPGSVHAQDFSPKQLQRILKQTFAITLLVEKLAKKDLEEIKIISDIQANENGGDRCARYKSAKMGFTVGKTIPEFLQQISESEWFVDFTDDLEVDDVEMDGGCSTPKMYAASTLKAWFYDFKKHENKGFSEDMRGKDRLPNRLEQYGLSEDFKRFTLCAKELSVNACFNWAAEKIAQKIKSQEERRIKLKEIVSRGAGGSNPLQRTRFVIPRLGSPQVGEGGGGEGGGVRQTVKRRSTATRPTPLNPSTPPLKSKAASHPSPASGSSPAPTIPPPHPPSPASGMISITWSAGARGAGLLAWGGLPLLPARRR